MKKKPPRRWSLTHLESIGAGFTFTPAQRQQIYATLPPEHRMARTFDHIQGEVRRCLGYSENVAQKPPAHVKSELAEVAKQTRALMILLERIHEDTETVIDHRLAKRKEPLIADVIDTLTTFGRAVDGLTVTYTQKTGRRGAPLSLLISQLLFWWENTTGQDADCQWNRAEEEYTGAFYTFASVVLDLVYGPNGYGKQLYSYQYPAARDKAIFRAVAEWTHTKQKMSEKGGK